MGTTRGGGAIFERNLAALAKTSPRIVAMLRDTTPRNDILFAASRDRQNDSLASAVVGGAVARNGAPVLTASQASFAGLGVAAMPTRLASAHHPIQEAERLAGTIELKQAGAVVVLGFGVGHHVASLALRMKRRGVIYVFEPDLTLLRSVFDRIDHSEWIAQTNLVILHDPSDAGAMTGATNGVEAILALGVKYLDHPASRKRLGDQAAEFRTAFASVVRAMRTNIVTTLVHADLTMRNLLMNLDHYALGPGVDTLAGIGAGRPAVVVSAGPSLKRNLHLLAQPGVRDRVVIVAVQTVLKALLERGIKPHFVTALDYAQISTRFYEGLTPQDVQGVTLVAEAKANPAILSAFPGEIRCPADGWMDLLLGNDLAGAHGALRSGSTVAHLAYYLARHLGCDPVILIGQDLGFTDGQYYATGAVIHNVWGGELNEFRTLEMLEWERIVRWRRNLIPAQDHLGRPVYTDEQMATYRVQFERDFGFDASRGLTTIDATEGGVAKQHTRLMPLAQALATHAPSVGAPLPRPSAGSPRPGRAEVASRVDRVLAEVERVARLSRTTKSKLDQMLGHHADQRRVNRLIGEVDKVRDEVQALQPAFDLVQLLNQTGLLKRLRADRDLDLDDPQDPYERQRRQIERDAMNVAWLADAADELAGMLRGSRAMLDGGAKVTRPPPPSEAILTGDRPAPKAIKHVHAVVCIDASAGGLGAPRDLAATIAPGVNVFQATVARLLACRSIDGVVVASHDPVRARALLGPLASRSSVRVEAIEPTDDRGALARRAIHAARLWARECWRGGLGGMTVFDEVLDPATLAPLMERLGIDAAVVLGGDWCLLDPALTDSIVERYREQPERHRLVFSQAAPGLGPCVVDRSMMAELANARHSPISAVFATLGGALGYIPIAPVADPIAGDSCVAVPAAVRDLGRRVIADSPDALVAIREVWQRIAEGSPLSGEELASAIASAWSAPGASTPWNVRIELNASLIPLLTPGWTPDSLARALGAIASDGPPIALTITGPEPLRQAELPELIRAARSAGAAGVHVRTPLRFEASGDAASDAVLQRLVASGVDVVSVDLFAETPATYASLAGGSLDRVRARLDRLISLRRCEPRGLPTPWIVPRITRRDAVYAEIEPFYDQWLLRCGAAVIDPLPASIPGERIEPLTPPALWVARSAGARALLRPDGSLHADPIREPA
jgi:hypothetical protein